MIRISMVAVAAGAAVVLAGCSSAPKPAAPSSSSGMDGMAGMDMAPARTAVTVPEAQPAGTGLAATVNGYTFAAPAFTPGTFDFHIDDPSGHPVTRYQPYQGELMQLDLVRADLTDYQHTTLAMRQDGTWVAQVPSLAAGSYRAYATFAAPATGNPAVYHLSESFSVPGATSSTALPEPATSDQVDGFTVALSGQARAGAASGLSLEFTKAGKPVTYFQRYLDGYAHLMAFHASDMAAAHFTPAIKSTDPHATSTLTTQALFPMAGMWRVFAQFNANGTVDTAAFTVSVS